MLRNFGLDIPFGENDLWAWQDLKWEVFKVK
jgi:hypothetical protein